MGALTTLADRSVAKLTEEEIIRRVVQSLADAAPAFPEGPGGDCAHLPTTGGRSIRASTIDSVILGRHFDAACDGIRAGAPVIAPGGLIGRVSSVTPTTARVELLTDSASRLGVWVARVQRHGLLVGQGTPRPQLQFLEKDTGVRPGDVITTSPASTLVPPNLLIGVVQSVNEELAPAPEATVQLSAPVDAVDWVQVVTR